MALRFRVGDITIKLRPSMLIWIPIYIVIGQIVARIKGLSQQQAWRLSQELIISMYLADSIHTLGHVISAGIAKSQMHTIDYAIMPRTLYSKEPVPPQTHITRALGGPIISAITAVLIRCFSKSKIAYGINLFIAVGSLLPLPPVDGGVIYRNLKKLINDQQ
jgi:Zn-dependent protease